MVGDSFLVEGGGGAIFMCVAIFGWKQLLRVKGCFRPIAVDGQTSGKLVALIRASNLVADFHMNAAVVPPNVPFHLESELWLL